jgi:hypothetical protein
MDTGEQFVTETRKVPVRGEYDVIVIGGGVAGVSAAVSARRAGMSVLLVEKAVMLGGLATMGLVIYYNPPLDDNKGRRLVGGLSRELLHRSIKYGWGSLSPYWAQQNPPADAQPVGRYQTRFNAPAFVVALDELIEEEGVTLLYDTVFCAPVMEGDRCAGVMLEGKGGRMYFKARAFVDASGDADLMFRAGATCVVDNNWLSYWTEAATLTSQAKAAAAKDVSKSMQTLYLGANAEGAGHPEGMGLYHGVEAEDVTRFIVTGRKLLRKRMETMDAKEIMVTTLPSMAQYRTTRHITGLHILGDADKDVHFDDSIGCFAEEGPGRFILEFPYRSLVAPEVSNILAAGRIIASEGIGRYMGRLIAPSSMTGEAAGRAAALIVKHNCAAPEVPVRELQQHMESAGYVLHV